MRSHSNTARFREVIGKDKLGELGKLGDRNWIASYLRRFQDLVVIPGNRLNFILVEQFE
ncbi:MAG: hypothetical protein F6K31_13365 [Symploca sp. SIO2G7]|nr:hypothetical protein [Symploca sp. SIO2G7]